MMNFYEEEEQRLDPVLQRAGNVNGAESTQATEMFKKGSKNK